jgi:hypothetical protein
MKIKRRAERTSLEKTRVANEKKRERLLVVEKSN